MQTEEVVSIDKEVEHVLTDLADMDSDSEEYKAAVGNLETLCRARSLKKATKIDWSLVISAGVSILEVLLILNHENLNVISTKALGFIFKGRA